MYNLEHVFHDYNLVIFNVALLELWLTQHYVNYGQFFSRQYLQFIKIFTINSTYQIWFKYF